MTDSQTVDQAIRHIIHIICMQCEVSAWPLPTVLQIFIAFTIMTSVYIAILILLSAFILWRLGDSLKVNVIKSRTVQAVD